MKYNHIALLLTVLASSASCGNKSNTEAQAMLRDIQAEIECGQYSHALEIMDSLDSRFPAATSERSEALKLRPKAMEGYTINQISVADSILMATQQMIENLSSGFEHIVNPKLVENYYVIKSAKKANLMTSTAIEPRVDEDYNFYLVGSLTGNDIGLYAIELTIGETTARSNEIPSGDERVFTSALGTKAVFSESDAEEIGKLAADSDASKGIITFIGRKGSKKLNLTAGEVEAIGNSYLYSKAHKNLMLAKIRREKLERQLQIARNQIANSDGYDQ